MVKLNHDQTCMNAIIKVSQNWRKR